MSSLLHPQVSHRISNSFKPLRSEYQRRAARPPELLFSLQSSSAVPIVPMTPGGLLIPFQPNTNAARHSGPFPRLGGYPSSLKNFQDIRQQIEQRAQLLSSLPSADRVPSPPVLSTGRTAYQAPPSTTGSLLSPATSGPYGRTGTNYSPPSFTGSLASGQTNPYRIVQP